jgi:hypothetical protein
MVRITDSLYALRTQIGTPPLSLHRLEKALRAGSD